MCGEVCVRGRRCREVCVRGRRCGGGVCEGEECVKVGDVGRSC